MVMIGGRLKRTLLGDAFLSSHSHCCCFRLLLLLLLLVIDIFISYFLFQPNIGHSTRNVAPAARLNQNHGQLLKQALAGDKIHHLCGGLKRTRLVHRPLGGPEKERQGKKEV